jgi:hypothetical protein
MLTPFLLHWKLVPACAGTVSVIESGMHALAAGETAMTGTTGADWMLTERLEELPDPQELVPATPSDPPAEPNVTVIELVPLPDVILAPEGKVQV